MDHSNNMANKYDEILIENKYAITKELVVKWVHENKKNTQNKIFWICMAILSFVLTILCILTNHMADGALSAIYTIFCILHLYLRYSATRGYNTYAKAYNKETWERRILFFNDYFEIIEENISVKYQYSDIVTIEKIDDHMILKLQKGRIRIYKNAFVKSGFEACEQFINEKTHDMEPAK
ncbi:MAG: hypothetical protein NC240_10055 [Clostridium sp.]|nr:hypothetical protein [Clostridium sp.]